MFEEGGLIVGEDGDERGRGVESAVKGKDETYLGSAERDGEGKRDRRGKMVVGVEERSLIISTNNSNIDRPKHAHTAMLLLFVRVLIALATRTVFQPDEYFQALEPAHHAVFGYGDLTWEWLAPQPIRSIVYPAINIPVYWLLKVTGLHQVDALLIAAPKVVHGILAAGTDVGLAILARRVLGGSYVDTAVFLSLTSFFNALALSRSLSNSLETSLSSLAFAQYPWDASPNLSPQIMYDTKRLRDTVLFSALACMIRPTNAIIWVFLYAKLLWSYKGHPKLALAFLRQLLVIG